MRTEVLEYNCRVKESKMCLFLEHWQVGTYPLTYSPQECLEEFCEGADWEFLECRGGTHVGWAYTFHCKVPQARLTMDIIYYWYHYHQDRLEAGAV